MSIPEYLLKFGELKYMKSFVEGNIYFSHAKRFREIEDELRRGQGDKLEGKAVVNSTRVRVTDLDNPNNVIDAKVGDERITVMVESVDNMPVFCLTGLYNENFCVEENRVIVNKNVLETIKEHFPKADTVVLIRKPAEFIHKIETEFVCKVVHEKVQYLNMNPVGMEWVKFVHNGNVEKLDGKTNYTMTKDNSHRILLCKDLFFSKEKEYRLILPNELISSPKIYKFSKIDNAEIIEFDKFCSNGFNI
ncbi:MAG: hypothetical protein U9Q80_10780 [Bacillota bacterium]|nr:hypothetical protein [Bacillota bacterium]